jgi:hypothetical protein
MGIVLLLTSDGVIFAEGPVELGRVVSNSERDDIQMQMDVQLG